MSISDLNDKRQKNSCSRDTVILSSLLSSIKATQNSLSRQLKNSLSRQLKNSCSRKAYTYEIHRRNETYIGRGDFHNQRYDQIMTRTSVQEFHDHSIKSTCFGMECALGQASIMTKFSDQDELDTILNELEICVYSIYIYPTDAYRYLFFINTPLFYLNITIMVFICMILFFILHDIPVECCQKHVMDSVYKSNH